VVLDGLAKARIKIQPYYLFVEGLFDGGMPHLEAGFDEYELGFLGPRDMGSISAIPYRYIARERFLLRLKEGKRCFAAKHRGNIAAFTWCDMNECHYKGCRFQLEGDEAYLFDAYTIDSYRGKGLAPYVRYHLYKELAKLGRKTLYSVSERFNMSSIRFKTKLNAKLVGRGLFVELFWKWHFSSEFKRMCSDVKVSNHVLPQQNV
jgi:GNAT superfamily N-acetyltransferase